jgi:hypothetical protein
MECRAHSIENASELVFYDMLSTGERPGSPPSMTLLMAVLTLLLQAEDPFPAARQAIRAMYSQPLAERVTLHLSSNKTHYIVGEPIHLKMTLRNTQREAVTGFFVAAPVSPKSEIRYRRRGSEFAVLPYPPYPRREAVYGEATVTRCPAIDVFNTLGPGERMTGESILAFDPVRRSFVLDQPGDYEFQVIYRDLHSEPNAVLESNTLQVVVEPPSSGEELELQAYTQDLALLTQYDPYWSYLQSETLQEAMAFLERFPASVYRQGVEDGLLNALNSRIVGGEATEEERELYDRLKPESP